MTPQYYQERKGIRLIMFSHASWVFPGESSHVDINTPEEAKIFHMAQKEDKAILLIPLEDGFEYEDLEDAGGRMGTLAYVRSVYSSPLGPDKAILEGVSRGRLDHLISEDPLEGEVTEFIYQTDQLKPDSEMELQMKMVYKAASDYVKAVGKIPMVFFYSLINTQDPEHLTNDLAGLLDFDTHTRISILNLLDLNQRLKFMIQACDILMKMMLLGREINDEANNRLQEQQKDMLLHEQMAVIREQLGETGDDPESLADTYRQAIEELPISDESKEQLLREVDRLSYVSPMSPELNVSRSYLDTILDLPWGQYTKDTTDLKRVRKVMDDDHYGLTDVKERILEYIAVQRLQDQQRGAHRHRQGSILCLVGPPGVGKTSIARSIARAMGRKFTAMRLGGITDESEIRGHRKTYVGSMPGRIISQMIRVDSMNPVFLLDELDKVGADYRGDPAAALLEVLDPEQNSVFQDRYLEIPFDLSQVMFLATANTTETIPGPLKDRMEIIRIPGYTEEEKAQIGRHYLVNKQRKENGLDGKRLRINQGVIEEIIRHYTREAGVRELERQIGKICRVAAKWIVNGEERVSVTVSNLKDFLDEPKYLDEYRVRSPQLGKVNGLAWTEVGGVILNIEANRMDGHGQLILTGSLGKVMQESAELAISYIRANARRFGLDPSLIQWSDIHIHMPEGAVPKDGPSAGVSILTAVLSVLTRRPVDSHYAMTGEITLTGKVLPVGGIKEKVLAARRYGIPKVILPRENMRDLKKLDANLARDLEFIPVDHVDELIAMVLMDPVEEKKPIVFQHAESQTMGFHSENSEDSPERKIKVKPFPEFPKPDSPAEGQEPAFLPPDRRPRPSR